MSLSRVFRLIAFYVLVYRSSVSVQTFAGLTSCWVGRVGAIEGGWWRRLQRCELMPEAILAPEIQIQRRHHTPEQDFT